MVQVSTLFFRVDGFDEFNTSFTYPGLLDLDLGDRFLEKLLAPLVYDPGDRVVNAILQKI